MRRIIPILMLSAIAACAMPDTGPQPSLAPRPAEAIDPRLPIPDEMPAGTVDPALAQRLDALVSNARSGAAGFATRQGDAERLAAAAGPSGSESWVTAQQALSLLVEQHGIATRAAAEIDELAADRLNRDKWIRPAEQAAISAAAAEVGAITSSQAATIQRLGDQLAR